MTAVLRTVPGALCAAIRAVAGATLTVRAKALGVLVALCASTRAVFTRVRTAGAQAGMSTAEYAVGLVAACAFAAVLYKILTSSIMQSLLRGLISRALHVTL